MIKRFYCGKCNDGYARTRHGLKKHLREEHLIKRKITNYYDKKLNKLVNQEWWKYD